MTTRVVFDSVRATDHQTRVRVRIEHHLWDAEGEESRTGDHHEIRLREDAGRWLVTGDRYLHPGRQPGEGQAGRSTDPGPVPAETSRGPR